MAMETDPFTDLSRDRFYSIQEGRDGRRGVLFRYWYRDSSEHRHSDRFFYLGLWISRINEWDFQYRPHDSYVDFQLHDALSAINACCTPSEGTFTVGLMVERPEPEGELPKVHIPSQTLSDYEPLKQSETVSLKDELEQRFGVNIVTGIDR